MYDDMTLEELLEEDQHDPEVQYQIGLRYFYGNGTEKDVKTAEMYIRLAAQQGHEAATLLLSGPAENGERPPLDESTLGLWCQAAEKGDAKAQITVAKWLMKNNTPESDDDIERYLSQAVSAGEADACVLLSEFYMRRNRTDEAITQLRNAADCGDMDSAERLAIYYSRGIYVEQDPAEAERRFVSLAEQDGEQMLKLARRYKFGQDFPQSLTRSLSWLQQAIDAGVENAQEQYDIEKTSSEEQLKLG